MPRDEPGGLGELCSLSGWLKLIEVVLTFMTLLIHRHGDNGHYLFFSTTALKLSNTDNNIDVENLGNSTLVTFMIIPLILIIGYVIDGKEFIQESILEPIWNFIGTFMFMAAGSCCIITWQGETMAKASKSSTLSELEYNRNVNAALGMGAMCIIIGLIYFIDTIVSFYNRKRLRQENEKY